VLDKSSSKIKTEYANETVTAAGIFTEKVKNHRIQEEKTLLKIIDDFDAAVM